MQCGHHVYKTKDDQTTGFTCSALTLQVEWQDGHPAHKNPVVVPVSLSFVRAPAHPGYSGLKSHKMVVHSFHSFINHYRHTFINAVEIISVCYSERKLITFVTY